MKLLAPYKWLIPAILIMLMASCSRKNYASRNQNTTEASANDNNYSNDRYQPPAYVYMSDDQAKTNRDGELYYIDPKGYRYWKFCDGKYYLDAKYDRLNADNTPQPKQSKKKSRKARKNNSDEEI